ncbi:hypothetical protein Hanom_Chr01g00070941 [Helianthus anomalus]
MMLMSRLSINREWLMTGMGEMYKYMGLTIPPRPPPRIYPNRGSFYTQQPDPSMPSFTQPILSIQVYGPSYTQPDFSMPHFLRSGQTMPLFHLSDLSMQALLCVARTFRRRSSLSLTRIDDSSGFFYMMQYCTNN